MEKLTEGYFPQLEKWSGRVDGVTIEHLRWHQVVEYVNLNDDALPSSGVCIIGFKSDKGIELNKGRKGACFAPNIIRKYAASLPWHFGRNKLYDAGNVVCFENLKLCQDILAEKIMLILKAGLFPIVLGGGHEVAFGSIMGNFLKDQSMPSVINLDSHFDLRETLSGPTSGNSFSEAYNMSRNVDQPFRYVCIGIQKSANTKYLFERAENIGAQWISLEDLTCNLDVSMEKVVRFLNNSDKIHLTLCMDVFSSDIAPGVSAPLPFGINMPIFIRLFESILKSGKVQSFDIAEVSPPLDIDDKTSRLAAHILFRLMDNLT
jgi:formiminoglutamase